jgi:hypothetical protein
MRGQVVCKTRSRAHSGVSSIQYAGGAVAMRGQRDTKLTFAVVHSMSRRSRSLPSLPLSPTFPHSTSCAHACRLRRGDPRHDQLDARPARRGHRRPLLVRPLCAHALRDRRAHARRRGRRGVGRVQGGPRGVSAQLGRRQQHRRGPNGAGEAEARACACARERSGCGVCSTRDNDGRIGESDDACIYVIRTRFMIRRRNGCAGILQYRNAARRADTQPAGAQRGAHHTPNVDPTPMHFLAGF